MHDPNVPGADSGAGMGRARRHWQSGQTLVVVAVLLVVLIGFLGLVIDGGNVYAQRRQMQNAADSAALAGARAVAVEGHGAVEGAADEYAQMNGATACTVVTTSTTVEAVVTKTVATYFIRILGIDDLPVGAHAVAEIVPATSCPVLPLAVQDLPQFGAFEAGTTFTIWVPNNANEDCSEYDGTYDIPPELHGWLDLSLDPTTPGAVGNAALMCWVCATCEDYDKVSLNLDEDGDGEVEEGEGAWVPQGTGLKSASLGEVVECNSELAVLIPVYDEVCYCKADPNDPESPLPACDPSLTCLGASKLYYHVVAFASVIIKTHDKPGGNCKPLDVEWVGMVTGEDCTGGTAATKTNAWKVHLIE